MSELICPKCGAPMRAYQRRDVTIERCPECRGIYLDQGELEHLTNADAASYRDRRYRDSDEDDDNPRERYSGRPRKRRGFLDDMLDLG